MTFFKDLDFTSIFTQENLYLMLRVGVYVLIGFIILRIIIFFIKRALRKRVSSQSMMLMSKAVNYIGLLIIFLVVLKTLGLSLTAVLGAAGVIGIAVGIASQTSISNIISGLFLVSEKPFEVGDVIKVGDKTGIIESVDLMSVKIRTFDNLFIRIPNETIIKTEVTNITRYPIRRMDFNISVAYKENLKTVHELLIDIADKNPDCLEEPAPLILFTDFGDSGISILFGIWFEKTNYIKVKNTVFTEIHQRFKEEDIEIPFPHVSLYTGSETAPLPVTLSGKKDSKNK